MPKRTPQEWETLEGELHAAAVSPEEIKAGARMLLAQARGHQLAQARKQLSLAQRDIAATMGVSIARISQIEHGEVTSFEVIARYVEALGGRLDLVADFGDRTSASRSVTPPNPPPPDLTRPGPATQLKSAFQDQAERLADTSVARSAQAAGPPVSSPRPAGVFLFDWLSRSAVTDLCHRRVRC